MHLSECLILYFIREMLDSHEIYYLRDITVSWGGWTFQLMVQAWQFLLYTLSEADVSISDTQVNLPGVTSLISVRAWQVARKSSTTYSNGAFQEYSMQVFAYLFEWWNLFQDNWV